MRPCVSIYLQNEHLFALIKLNVTAKLHILVLQIGRMRQAHEQQFSTEIEICDIPEMCPHVLILLINFNWIKKKMRALERALFDSSCKMNAA